MEDLEVYVMDSYMRIMILTKESGMTTSVIDADIVLALKNKLIRKEMMTAKAHMGNVT